MRIRSIRHKGLRRLYERDDASLLPPASTARIRNMLAAMAFADDISHLKAMPGWRLHPLTGDRKGQWSLAVTANFRLIFKLEENDTSISILRTTISKMKGNMEMGMTPPHPGAFLRMEVAEALGLTASRIAEILHVRRATVSDLLHEKTPLSPEMALRWDKAFGISMEMMLRMQAGYEADQMRRQASSIKVQRYEKA